MVQPGYRSRLDPNQERIGIRIWPLSLPTHMRTRTHTHALSLFLFAHLTIAHTHITSSLSSLLCGLPPRHCIPPHTHITSSLSHVTLPTRTQCVSVPHVVVALWPTASPLYPSAHSHHLTSTLSLSCTPCCPPRAYPVSLAFDLVRTSHKASFSTLPQSVFI